MLSLTTPWFFLVFVMVFSIFNTLSFKRFLNSPFRLLRIQVEATVKQLSTKDIEWLTLLPLLNGVLSSAGIEFAETKQTRKMDDSNRHRLTLLFMTELLHSSACKRPTICCFKVSSLVHDCGKDKKGLLR